MGPLMCSASTLAVASETNIDMGLAETDTAEDKLFFDIVWLDTKAKYIDTPRMNCAFLLEKYEQGENFEASNHVFADFFDAPDDGNMFSKFLKPVQPSLTKNKFMSQLVQAGLKGKDMKGENGAKYLEFH